MKNRKMEMQFLPGAISSAVQRFSEECVYVLLTAVKPLVCVWQQRHVLLQGQLEFV